MIMQKGDLRLPNENVENIKRPFSLSKNLL